MNSVQDQRDTANSGNVSFNKRRKILILIDIFCYLAAYLINVEIGLISSAAVNYPWFTYIINAAIILAALLGGRVLLSVYKNVWRYPNVLAYLTVVVSDAVVGAFTYIILHVLPASWKVNIGFYRTFLVIALFTLATLTNRFVYQLLHQRRNQREEESRKPEDGHKIGIAIVGAGSMGVRLAEDLLYRAGAHYRPLCFVDCDTAKIGAKISGLPVYSDEEFINRKIKELPVQEIFIVMQNVSADHAHELYKVYSHTGCKIKLYEFPMKDSDESEIASKRRGKIREIRIEDLLFRDPLTVKDERADAYYRGKTVLVTGGGGSIGSELCRQIAACGPAHLIILDIYENNAYAIQQELIRHYGDGLNLTVEIASVRDKVRLEAIFKAYTPQIVFHAAAHKHVPLMEHSAVEAIKNNVMGTYNTANMAEKYGVEKFILVSTDKAVNPTNVMGASKRMCEMVVQCRTDSKTTFAAVRFGNVLGSNGSVIPLFREQIEKGGPVTVTDKRIIRYFMTIPEAVCLVMQTGFMAKNGELFVLNMGKPVRILDLAENMIRMAGYTPYVDMDIVEIGLRPGEKLYEELLMKSETLSETDTSLIFIEKDTPETREAIEAKLENLQAAVVADEAAFSVQSTKRALKRAVKTYRDPEDVNKTFDESEEKKLSEEETEAPAAVGAGDPA